MRLNRGDKIFACFLVPGLLLAAGYVSVGMYRTNIHIRHVQTGVQIDDRVQSLSQYLSDSGGKFPPNEKAVEPYEADTSSAAFYDSSVSVDYNTSLAGLNEKSLSFNPVTFYESRPDFEGLRWVAYLRQPSGRPYSDDPAYSNLNMVNEEQWESIKKTQGIR